ncbi:hypothetical protein Q8W71_31035 [Methylobacterium sp. NEAU 140]|uniref:hypothetical protein n=1 Tax=Methylobacterium sp. NEAU 140 TaxID=3064945 RepID=UPI002732546A|nr:hypothetical protein [Methylobacterium sp. NEAU 140]MDP4027027.1 hypothetical protein [Methylobacterium sp. NEAU 140]
MPTQTAAPLPARDAADADEEARFRARMARVGSAPDRRPAQRRRSARRAPGEGGLRLGWKSWLAIDCAVVLLVVAGVVAWPPVQSCREQQHTTGFYAGDSVGKCIRRGVGARIAQADQRIKMLIRGSGH